MVSWEKMKCYCRILPQRTIALTEAMKKTIPGILKTQKQVNDGLNVSIVLVSKHLFFFIISPSSKIFLSTHFQYVYNVLINYIYYKTLAKETNLKERLKSSYKSMLSF